MGTGLEGEHSERGILEAAEHAGYEWVWTGQSGPDDADEIARWITGLDDRDGERYWIDQESAGLIVATRLDDRGYRVQDGTETIYVGTDDALDVARATRRVRREIDNPRMTRMMIQVPEGMRELIKATARRDDVSYSEVVRRALEDYL